MKSLSKYIDPFQLIGFGISLAVSLGLIWAKQDTLLSLLIGLALGAITQLFDLQARMIASSEKLENLVVNAAERVIRSLDGVDVRRFTDGQEFYEYVIRRMREAKKTIDDMTFGEDVPEHTLAAQESYQRYIQTVDTVCQKKTIAYRELMSFPPYFERAESRLAKGLHGYRMAYYLFSKEDTVPVLQFMVIDSEEVIIGFYQAYSETRATRPIQISVKHPDIVSLFQDYYNVMWENAKPLKDTATLQEIRKRFTQQGAG